MTITPSRIQLQSALDSMIDRALGDPRIVRRIYLGLAKYFQAIHGEEGAEFVEATLKDLAREHGFDPSEWIPRVKESRVQVIQRISNLGSRELDLVKRTKSYKQYQSILRHIQLDIMEYVLPQDEDYVSGELREALFDLKIEGRWEILPRRRTPGFE
jgi:hypothetical protein